MNVTYLDVSILNIRYFFRLMKDFAFLPVFFCGILPFLSVTIKDCGMLLLTPPAEKFMAISTVSDRTAGRNCTHGRKALSVLSARFVIQNVWRSVHEICWSMSLQCGGMQSFISSMLRHTAVQFRIRCSEDAVLCLWVRNGGVAEDRSAFILKG